MGQAMFSIIQRCCHMSSWIRSISSTNVAHKQWNTGKIKKKEEEKKSIPLCNERYVRLTVNCCWPELLVMWEVSTQHGHSFSTSTPGTKCTTVVLAATKYKNCTCYIIMEKQRSKYLQSFPVLLVILLIYSFVNSYWINYFQKLWPEGSYESSNGVSPSLIWIT